MRLDGALPIIYLLGTVFTDLYLCYVDWQTVDNFFALLICFALNTFLASIWPIYWGLLHWLF